MGKNDPKSQSVGNTDDSKRGRDLDGAKVKVKARINNETTLKEVKAKRK